MEEPEAIPEQARGARKNGNLYSHRERQDREGRCSRRQHAPALGPAGQARPEGHKIRTRSRTRSPSWATAISACCSICSPTGARADTASAVRSSWRSAVGRFSCPFRSNARPGLRTRKQCGVSSCGACTVHIDGQVARACITPISSVGAAQVTTIEAIGQTPIGQAVQKAWLDVDVMQCA